MVLPWLIGMALVVVQDMVPAEVSATPAEGEEKPSGTEALDAPLEAGSPGPAAEASGAPITSPNEQQSAQQGEVDKARAEAIISQCGARKFESTAISNNAGKARKAKILLCAKPDDTDKQWIATLEKAATDLEASEVLSREAKLKLIGELKVEISRLRGEPQGR